jgi:S-adenosylmethionine-dependent methyltransferase
MTVSAYCSLRKTTRLLMYLDMATFALGEQQWIARLGNLRNTIRQEVIRRQLAEHARPGMSVLDVGCGQGTQAIGLAKLDCVVTGVEPSEELRSLCLAAAKNSEVSVILLDGTIDRLGGVVSGEVFDLVCAHGLLMYLPDRPKALAQLVERVRPGGQLSITFRNGHALAMRPGLRRDWALANASFGTRTYINELGVEARADLIDEVTADLEILGMKVTAWYGVRVFNDAVAADTPIDQLDDLDALLDAEDHAGRLDPYRWMASMIHLVATSV